MDITLIMRSSINGKITHSDDPDETSWSSKEDQILFSSLKQTHNLIVMGSETYMANKERMKLKNNVLRIVFTRNPKKFRAKEITNRLEFVNTTPKKLVHNLESRGYTKMLLVGGSEINALFFKNNLIDKLHLTIEPRMFGLGKNIIAEQDYAVQLQLVSVKKLNDAGTLHAIYSIVKP
ncbi:MAG: dihydrofolate reductase family protein [Patescibacteria group bacterium]|mgnify:CR=1 FL=1